ncbi:unnamed protein product [marine sediment metagenome]|uniref:Uncharacterized protein n=1 Tax=marine sediment metagenome TaxID=412755 RepID=X1RCQ3_9ZZZZ
MKKKIIMDVHFKSGEYENKMIAEASLEEVCRWIEQGKVLILKDNEDTEFIINFGAVEKIRYRGTEESENGA